MPRALIACIGVGALLCGIAGCGDELGPRQEISGSVRMGGQPLDEGAIEFMPLAPAAAGEIDTQSGAPITQGKYTIPRANGLMPGKYRVSITSAGPTEGPKPGELPGPSGPSPKERVPAKYNTDSELEATVTSAGPNTFDFEIP